MEWFDYSVVMNAKSAIGKQLYTHEKHMRMSTFQLTKSLIFSNNYCRKKKASFDFEYLR